MRCFLRLQEDDLQQGLVFREFIDLEPLATHSRSGMPLTKEYRLFFLDGTLMLSVPYWEEGEYNDIVPPVDHFQTIGREVRSRFFTMDVAQGRDGEWLIIELGDGQVAGLPGATDAITFYQALVSNINGYR